MRTIGINILFDIYNDILEQFIIIILSKNFVQNSVLINLN